MSNKTTFVSFFPSRPIWVGEALDLSAPDLHRNFTQRMSEIVYSASTANASIKVCRDGCFMLRLEDLENLIEGDYQQKLPNLMSYWGAYLDFLNTFYLMLDSAFLEIDNLAYFNLSEITNKDAFRIQHDEDGIKGYGVSTESTTSIYQDGRYACNYRQDLPLETDPKLSMRPIMTLESIDLAVNNLLKIMEQQGAEKHLASYAKSLSEYKIGNYSTAIVLAWFIIESIANRLWHAHLNKINHAISEKKLRINSERKKNLTGQLFTANITINILELLEIIDYELFESLDKCRSYRNRVAHAEDYNPTSEEAQLALMAAKKMIQKEWDITFTPNLGYSVRF